MTQVVFTIKTWDVVEVGVFIVAKSFVASTLKTAKKVKTRENLTTSAVRMKKVLVLNVIAKEDTTAIVKKDGSPGGD